MKSKIQTYSKNNFRIVSTKLIIALALMMSLIGFSQETTPKPKKPGMAKMNSEQSREKYLAHLTKELNLDTKQQAEVSKIVTEKSSKMQNFKSDKHNSQQFTPEEKEIMKKKMIAEKEDTDKRMKAILSDEQYKKWESLRQENANKLKSKGSKAKMTPEQHQEKHLAHLTKELNLDTKQQDEVNKILTEKRDKMSDLKAKAEKQKENGKKMTTEEKQALKSKMASEKEDTEKRMKAILSDEQYKKWERMREEKVDKLKEHKGKSKGKSKGKKDPNNNTDN